MLESFIIQKIFKYILPIAFDILKPVFFCLYILLSIFIFIALIILVSACLTFMFPSTSVHVIIVNLLLLILINEAERPLFFDFNLAVSIHLLALICLQIREKDAFRSFLHLYPGFHV